MGPLKTKLYNEVGIQVNETQAIFQASLLFLKNIIQWFTSIFK